MARKHKPKDGEPPENQRGEPVPSSSDGRPHRAYTDVDRLMAMHAVAEEGGNITRAAAALGIPYGTIESWTRLPRWAAELAQIREANNRSADDLRDALKLGYLVSAQKAKALMDTLIDQERRISEGEVVPADTRVRASVASAACRETMAAFAVLDRASKTVTENAASEGGVVVQVIRGGSVKREPSAVES